MEVGGRGGGESGQRTWGRGERTWARAARLRRYFFAHRDPPHRDPPLEEAVRGRAALGGFGDCARWSPPLVRPDSSAFLCPRSQERDKPGFVLSFSCLFLIEHGNLPNCLLNSSTLTTYKLWIHMAFWLVSPAYHPQTLPFLSLCTARLHCHLRQSPRAHSTQYFQSLAFQIGYILRSTSICATL